MESNRRLACWILLAAAVGTGAAGCGSSGGGHAAGASSSPAASSASASASSPAASSPVASSPAAAVSGPAAVQAITTNWTAFFNPKTTAAQRASLLQDGQAFDTILQSQAGNKQAAVSSAKVTAVTVTSASQATVVYDILLSGTPVLTGQKGTAVFENGAWVVGDASFCGLLTLEANGSTAGLPAA